MQHKDYFVVICSQIYAKEIRNQLIDNGYCEQLILSTQLGYPEIQCGWQYFDVFEPREREIFLDAGGYDGYTSIEFWKWSNNAHIKKAICLEPMMEMYKIMINNVKDIDCIAYNCAAWNENKSLEIVPDLKHDGSAGVGGGSKISRTDGKGSIVVQGKKIDTISEKHGEITFIKMDVEGSELEALEGARKTIEQYAPRLAVSLYHKPSDIIDIPSYILQIRKDYRFVIRHYTGDSHETVLYAY